MPNPIRHSAIRFTAADDAALATIADAMRKAGMATFPNRTSAFRYALHATAEAMGAADATGPIRGPGGR